MQKETLTDLLGQVWQRRDGSTDPKMVEHCIKNSVYLDMGNYYLQVMSKPSIDKTIYYADEDRSTGKLATDPGTSFEVFKNYNLFLNSPQKKINFLTEQEVIIIDQYYNKATNKLKAWQTRQPYELLPTDRVATAEEKQAILTELEKQLELYEQRLERYYKRYGHKVTTSSYWADR